MIKTMRLIQRLQQSLLCRCLDESQTALRFGFLFDYSKRNLAITMEFVGLEGYRAIIYPVSLLVY